VKKESVSTTGIDPSDIAMYECLTEFRQPLIQSIIDSLNLPETSSGFDAGCGIGAITAMLADKVGEKGQVIGLDFSKDIIQLAINRNTSNSVQFIEGDVNNLRFDDQTFDWIWSMDTVWPGPKELGCPADDPTPIVNQYHRVLKPGGTIRLLYWSSQKLLPGHPVLESRLNATSPAVAPATPGMKPAHHIFNARTWLETAGFQEVSAQSFVGDISGPLSANDRKALLALFQMLWGQTESEVEQDVWRDFKTVCSENSEHSVLNNPRYYGFYTYTLFQGRK